MASNGHYNKKGLYAQYDKNKGLTLDELAKQINKTPEVILSGYYKVVESLKNKGVLLTKEGHSPDVKYFLEEIEPEEFKYTLYIHKNKINNKVYVGQTRQMPQERWRIDGKGYKRQVKFWNAIQKYGWDNFEHIIVEENISPEDIDQKEKDLIIQYNSIENGYNIALGGGSVKYFYSCNQKSGKDAPWYGKKHTEEYKQKMSKQMKEKWENPEYREKVCENMKKNHANFKGGLHPEAKAVYCIDKDIEMPSCKDMAEYLGCENTTTGAKGIATVCRGITITYKGLHFIWAGDKNNQEKIQEIWEKERNRGFREGTFVKCVETGTEYISCAHAARAVHGHRSNIRRVCNKPNRTSMGYHWITVEKGDN